MKKIAHSFLKDCRGNKSSKRLGFLTSLANWFAMGWITLAVLLWKDQYQYAVDLVQAAGLACFGFAGVIASEFFAKTKNEKDNVDTE